MKLNLNDIFSEQKRLNNFIFKNHQVNSYKKVINEIYLALYVELGELANEVRCFKYWSNKPRSEKEKILDEYADGLHFIVSICISFHTIHHLEVDDFHDIKRLDKKSITEVFNKLFSTLHKVDNNKDALKWLRKYIHLGFNLGFNINQIRKAYYKKHEVNVQRQKQNY